MLPFRRFGARAAGPRRPMLLALVYGVFLVLVGVTASALVAVSSQHLTTATMNAVVSRDGSLIGLFVNSNVRAQDLDADGPSVSRRRELEEQLSVLTAEDAIARIEVRAPDGRILFGAPRRSAGGDEAPLSMGSAMDGKPSVSLREVDPTQELDLPADVTTVLEEYLPIVSDGETMAVVAVWRDATPLLTRLDEARRDVVIVTLVAAGVLAVILFLIFRAAQSRLLRQQRQLIEAERRDALTELLNHGALVALLAESMEQARGRGERIGVALLDIDNFRLVNDTHGHDAADEVLLTVAELVDDAGGDGRHVGRYGPDEFLVFALGDSVADMEAAVQRLRSALAQTTVQFGDSERLPVTISAGIAAYPEHATSVTDLLSAAAVALGEAKNSGGDATRTARAADDQPALSGSFDVLQGLIIAVDTKDRYTKRHSEDVARYAVFLADQLSLDTDVRESIHLAGLLHDVGKIGIPDKILRKPSKLTAEEHDAVKQHVALGESLVRDVRHVDIVRAGIRNHHERWDGKGYLNGLEGGEIPLIGRILAVADAFSAMTTTRPYRKALSVEEALKRLGDAAGTQLEEELVRIFIEGIESAPGAPMPGDDAGHIWQPERKIA